MQAEKHAQIEKKKEAIKAVKAETKWSRLKLLREELVDRENRLMTTRSFIALEWVESKQNKLVAINCRKESEFTNLKEIQLNLNIHLLQQQKKNLGGMRIMDKIFYQCVLIAVVNHPSLFDGRTGSASCLSHRLYHPH